MPLDVPPMPHQENVHMPRLLSRTATFLHAIYSPKGGIEGMLVELDSERVQFAFKHEPRLEEIVGLAMAGDLLDVEIEPMPPSDKGNAQHAIYRLAHVVTPREREDAVDAAGGSTSGVVARLNYALHGEANGVVLDNGDFVHLRPDGMKQAKLAVGARVTAQGPARRLRFAEGRVIAAETVNGHALAKKAKPHSPKPASKAARRAHG